MVTTIKYSLNIPHILADVLLSETLDFLDVEEYEVDLNVNFSNHEIEYVSDDLDDAQHADILIKIYKALDKGNQLDKIGVCDNAIREYITNATYDAEVAHKAEQAVTEYYIDYAEQHGDAEHEERRMRGY